MVSGESFWGSANSSGSFGSTQPGPISSSSSHGSGGQKDQGTLSKVGRWMKGVVRAVTNTAESSNNHNQNNHAPTGSYCPGPQDLQHLAYQRNVSGTSYASGTSGVTTSSKSSHGHEIRTPRMEPTRYASPSSQPALPRIDSGEQFLCNHGQGGTNMLTGKYDVFAGWTGLPPWAFHSSGYGEEVTVGQCLEDRNTHHHRPSMPFNPSTFNPATMSPHSPIRAASTPVRYSHTPSPAAPSPRDMLRAQSNQSHRVPRPSNNTHLEVPHSSSRRSSGSGILDKFFNMSRSVSAPPARDGVQPSATPSKTHPYHTSLSDDEGGDGCYHPVDNSPSERSWSIPSPMMTKDIVYLLFSSPLIISEADPRPVPQIKIRAEVELIIGAFQESGSNVEVRVGVATAQNLCQILASRSRFLHLSAHSLNGPEGIGLLLEDGQGGGHVIRQAELERLLRTGSTGNLSCVLINACQSESVGSLFVDAGVPHVLCCRGKVLDAASRLFTKTFYMCLGSGRSLRQSWDSAREAVRLAPRIQLQQHAEDFVMFGQSRASVTLGNLLANTPTNAEAKFNHAHVHHMHQLSERAPVAPYPPVFSARKASYWEDGQSSCNTFDLLPARVEDYLGRGVEMAKVLRCFCHDDVTTIQAGRRCVNIHGGYGLGKTAFVLETGYYASLPGRIFSRMAAYALVPDYHDDWSEFILDAIQPLLAPLTTSATGLQQFSLMRDSSPCSHDGGESVVGSEFGMSAYSAMSPRMRPVSPGTRLLQSLHMLERLGRRSLLILDTEDGIPLADELQTLLGTLLDQTNTFCVLCACREPLYVSFGQKKLINIPLEPLQPVDAARLFLRRTHRGLYAHDVDRNIPAPSSQEGVPADFRGQPLDEITAIRHLQNHPLMGHLKGYPESVRKAAGRVTPKLNSLWELFDQIQNEKDEPPPQRERKKPPEGPRVRLPSFIVKFAFHTNIF